MGRGGCPGRVGGGSGAKTQLWVSSLAHFISSLGGGGQNITPLPKAGSVSKTCPPQRRQLPEQPTGHPLRPAAASWGSNPRPRACVSPVLRGSSQLCTIPFGGPQPEVPIVGTQSLPHLLTPPYCCFVSFLPFLLPNTPASKQAAVDQPNPSASPLPGPWSRVLGPWGGTSQLLSRPCLTPQLCRS